MRAGAWTIDDAAITGELAAAARACLSRSSPRERYQILVGLVLADPGDIALQRALLAARPRAP